MNSAAVDIGHAETADIPALIALNRIVQRWHALHYPHVFKPEPDDASLRQFFANNINADNTFIDVVRDGSNVVSYLFTRLHEREETPITYARRHMHIEHICVAQSHRRQGIGTALLNVAEHRAREMHCSEITLDSWARNTDAHIMFTAFGFEHGRHWFSKSAL